MLKEFKNYVNQYDLNNLKIKLKYNHSLRVMKLARKYAKLLNFNKEDIELASLIGLLHDIGRFEQLKVYDTFNDKDSIDHADYSIEQLFKKDYIKLFCNKLEWYPIIENAIKYHNKLSIPDFKNHRMMKHIKLIRDVDKLDIIYLLGYLDEMHERVNDEDISTDVLNDIKTHQLVDRRNVKNSNDSICVNMALIFEIYNDTCLKECKKNLKYYYKIVSENSNKLDDIYKEVINYIDERIGKYERNRNEI